MFWWVKQTAGHLRLKARGRSQGGGGIPAVYGGLQADTDLQPAQSPEQAGSDGMKAAIKGPITLVIRIEVNLSNL